MVATLSGPGSSGTGGHKGAEIDMLVSALAGWDLNKGPDLEYITIMD